MPFAAGGGVRGAGVPGAGGGRLHRLLHLGRGQPGRAGGHPLAQVRARLRRLQPQGQQGAR